MIQYVKDIQMMLDNNNFDRQRLLEILESFEIIPTIPILIPVGNKILRSSTNDEHKFHESVARLNYPPAEYARTDRTSLKGKPMFYGTVFTSSAKTEGGLPRIFSAFETTDILRDYNAMGRVITTQSVWMNDRDLILFAFPYARTLNRACDEIKAIWAMWDKRKDIFAKDAIEFSEFIGDIITRPAYSCLYDITATITDYVLNNIGLESGLYEGIYYPSVWGDGAGVNICLKTDIVDECVKFKDAKVVLFDKTVGNTTAPTIADCILTPDNSLSWIPNSYTLELFKQEYGFKEIYSINQGIVGIK